MARAVLFDLFETLMTDFSEVAEPTPPPWSLAGDELGIGQDAFRRGWSERKVRRMTSEVSYVDALREICVACGVSPPEDKIDALNQARQAAREQAFRSVPRSVLAMLDELRSAHLGIVVVSNCSVEEAEHFAASPLSLRVDEVLWSFREGVQKPDPEIFRRACDRAGCVPADAVFVGDGSFDELRGAAKAGITPIWASWFISRWPSHLAAQRRLDVEGLDVREASSPEEVLPMVRAMLTT